MSEIKFTDEEMQQLKKLQDDFNNLILQFGQMEIEGINLGKTITRLNEAKLKLQEQYQELLSVESTLSTELNKKYGDGILDPKTGIFTPSVKQESNQ